MSHFLTLFDLIGTLARRRYLTAERRFSALGLNHTEARLLTLLKEAGGEITQDDLSQQLIIDRSNAGRALKCLEETGYISRHKTASDKRTNLVKISDQGRKAAADIAAIKIDMAQAFFGELSEEEAGTIVSLLAKAPSSD